MCPLNVRVSLTGTATTTGRTRSLATGSSTGLLQPGQINVLPGVGDLALTIAPQFGQATRTIVPALAFVANSGFRAYHASRTHRARPRGNTCEKPWPCTLPWRGVNRRRDETCQLSAHVTT